MTGRDIFPSRNLTLYEICDCRVIRKIMRLRKRFSPLKKDNHIHKRNGLERKGLERIGEEGIGKDWKGMVLKYYKNNEGENKQTS